jgi:hypothetical protein
LESTVLTDRGKEIVQAYEGTFMYQEVYKRLTEHHLKSTKTRIESSTILSYITSVRLESGEWNGSSEGLITHWTNQVRLYEWQVPISDHFPMVRNKLCWKKQLQQFHNCVKSRLEQT